MHPFFIYLKKKFMLEFIRLKETIEIYFSSMATGTEGVLYSHKIMPSVEGLETMVCYLEKDNQKYQLDIQLEDKEYINILLIKIVDHKPVDLGFVNYLTNSTEMLLSLNFLVRLYLD